MAVFSFLDREHSVARPGYSRWLIPPAALAVHICIGQVYATSVYKSSLVKEFGNDAKVGYIFSLAIVMLGISSAVFGKWVDLGGPRRAMFTSACCWSVGLLLAGVGVSHQQLWLVYLGYGVIGGIALGIGYISPVSTLIKWFPDRPGLATGMAIMGFGGGALIASPLSTWLMGQYGTVVHPCKITDLPAAGLTQCPTALVNSTASIFDPGTVGKMFFSLAVIYFIVMMFGVFTVRVPAPGWKPAHWDPATSHTKAAPITGQVSADNAIKTPQFYLLWLVLFCNVTAGIGILENASPMVQDFFRGTSHAIVPAAAVGFVGLLSLFNMGGRFAWSTVSDYLGRKVNYTIYLGVGILLFILLATVASSSVILFVAVCAVAVSFYGGGFSTVPAYLRDLFGTYQVGAIHGRLLTAWSAAGIVGPLIVNKVLDHAASSQPAGVLKVTDASGQLVPYVAPNGQTIATHAVDKSGHVVPGFLSHTDYHLAMWIMVGILIVGFVANQLIRPVSAKFHETSPVIDSMEAAH